MRHGPDAPIDTDDRPVAQQYLVERDGRDVTRRKADDEVAAAITERAQRRLGQRAADGIHHEVDTGAFGPGPRRVLDRFVRRVEHRLCAGIEGRLPLVRARCDPQHPAAQRARHSDGGQPDASAGSEDEHALAGRRLGPVAQGEQARAVTLGEGGGPGRIQALGQGDGRGRRHDDAAGEATQAHRGQHPVTHGHRVDVRTDRRDMPGYLAARHEGERGLHLVLPGHEEPVHEIHACRLDCDGDLARTGLRVGSFLHVQDRRWAQLMADGGAHGQQPNGAPPGPWSPSKTPRTQDFCVAGARPGRVVAPTGVVFMTHSRAL